MNKKSNKSNSKSKSEQTFNLLTSYCLRLHETVEQTFDCKILNKYTCTINVIKKVLNIRHSIPLNSLNNRACDSIQCIRQVRYGMSSKAVGIYSILSADFPLCGPGLYCKDNLAKEQTKQWFEPPRKGTSYFSTGL